jgi:hypothetical protein
LIWESNHLIVDGFSGAQPLKLCAPSGAISNWLQAAGPGCSVPLLSRVRDMRFDNNTLQLSSLAAALQAAPELRTLHGGTIFTRLQWRNDPAFVGLVHRKLRSLQFSSPRQDWSEDYFAFAAEYDMLREHHFPQLRGLTLDL